MPPFYKFLPLLLLVVVTLPADSYAQTRRKAQPVRPSRFSSLDRVPNRKVAVELQRQQEFLRGVTSRFEAMAVHDVTPLLQYSYVWTALRDNRVRMAKQVRGMTAEQTKLVTKGYDVLEKEVVASFGDYQLSILNEILELNEMQQEVAQKAVEDDLNARRSLLKTKGIDLGDFTTRLSAISRNTEETIRAMLFPEQQKRFEREINFSRDRLVG